MTLHTEVRKTSAKQGRKKLSRETAKSKDPDSTKSRERDREAITSSDRRLKNENREKVIEYAHQQHGRANKSDGTTHR